MTTDRRLTADDLAEIRARANSSGYGRAALDTLALLDEVELADEQLGDCWTLLHEMYDSPRPLPGELRLRIRQVLADQGCPGYGECVTIRTETA